VPKSRCSSRFGQSRNGATLALAAGLVLVIAALVAFAVDLGYGRFIRTHLQTAADTAAVASAAAMNNGGERAQAVARECTPLRLTASRFIQPADTDVEFGAWDYHSRTFQTTDAIANAVRVTVRATAPELLLGRIFGRQTLHSEASAVAAANPRDIAFVVDISATMNDDATTSDVHRAGRQAIVATLQLIEERNRIVLDPNHRDWVSLITFGSFSRGGPVVLQPLTSDYGRAITACASVQATSVNGAGTTTDAGLARARKHLAPRAQGGVGRDRADKFVVLLISGLPTTYISSPDEIDAHRSTEPSPDYYADGAYWLDAPLVLAAKLRAQRWRLYPIGLSPATDNDFIDRLARLGGTADSSGHAPRASGNPAEHEQRLIDFLAEIVRSPQISLVK
jgi:hypothetical protein